MDRIVVELYTKPGCSLCEEALDALESVAERVPFELRTHNILADETLWVRYRHAIPVVAVNGETVCSLCVDPAVVERSLRIARGMPAASS